MCGIHSLRTESEYLHDRDYTRSERLQEPSKHTREQRTGPSKVRGSILRSAQTHIIRRHKRKPETVLAHHCEHIKKRKRKTKHFGCQRASVVGQSHETRQHNRRPDTTRQTSQAVRAYVSDCMAATDGRLTRLLLRRSLAQNTCKSEGPARNVREAKRSPSQDPSAHVVSIEQRQVSLKNHNKPGTQQRHTT